MNLGTTVLLGLAVTASTACIIGGESSGDASKRNRPEVWVTHQTPDSTITSLSLTDHPQVLGSFLLPAGTLPHYLTWGDGDYAYIAGMGDGTVNVVHANSQTLVARFAVAPMLTHQIKVAPNRRSALVSVISTKTILKMNVDERRGAFSMSGDALTLAKNPICAIYRADSKRAYVSTLPNGLAVIDTATWTQIGEIATDGFIACGMIKQSESADHAIIAASGGGCVNTPTGTNCGHIYTLDMKTDTLIDRGSLPDGVVHSWHSWNNNEDETIGYGTAPFDDAIVAVDLTTNPVSVIGTMVLDEDPNGPDQPDAMGAGIPIKGSLMPVSLRASGFVDFVDIREQEVEAVNMLAPSVTNFHPVLCNGCAVHGISPRPRD